MPLNNTPPTRPTPPHDAHTPTHPPTHPHPLQVILLTDDADSRRKAADLGVEALGSAAYARLRAGDAPELQDLVAAAAAARGDAEGGAGPAGGGGGGGKGRAAKRQRVYEEHRPMSEVTAGIKAGRYHQGTLRWGRLEARAGSKPALGTNRLPLPHEPCPAFLPGWPLASGLASSMPWRHRAAPASPSAHAATPACPQHLPACRTPAAGSTASTRLRAGWAPSRRGRTS